VVEEERRDYDAALAAGPSIPPGQEAELDMRVLLVHGDEQVADSQEAGLAAACEQYKQWLRKAFPQKPAAADAAAAAIK